MISFFENNKVAVDGCLTESLTWMRSRRKNLTDPAQVEQT